MKQRSLAESGFERKHKVTRREAFLTEMDAVVPWGRLVAVIAPHYPVAGNGRRPYDLETMLRLHFAQHWFNLSDRALEDALHDMPVLRRFAGLDAGTDTLPDETTVLHFRHLLEQHGLAAQIFAEVQRVLKARGLVLREGTIVDATLINAPSSTKNATGTRDPAMSQTRKGNQWYFGMKAHIGVDAASGVVHTVTTTTARVADAAEFPKLLHGQERRVLADRGYDYPHVHEHLARAGVTNRVARRRRRGQRVTQRLRQFNRRVAQRRALGEHPFRILKRQFGFTKVRYRGLAKNTAHLTTAFALVNLYQVRRELLGARM
jgi:IS5 family transposase